MHHAGEGGTWSNSRGIERKTTKEKKRTEWIAWTLYGMLLAMCCKIPELEMVIEVGNQQRHAKGRRKKKGE
jgi:hypothetical protein